LLGKRQRLEREGNLGADLDLFLSNSGYPTKLKNKGQFVSAEKLNRQEESISPSSPRSPRRILITVGLSRELNANEMEGVFFVIHENKGIIKFSLFQKFVICLFFMRLLIAQKRFAYLLFFLEIITLNHFQF